MTSLAPVFRASTGAAALAAFVAAVRRTVEPLDHGIWLVSYLFLVGSVAQYLLSRGQNSIALGTPRSVLRTEALLWGAGVVAVPLGVFCDSRLLVIVGSVPLLAALFLFHRATTGSAEPRSATRVRLVLGYRGLLIFMTLSVLVGVAFAWDMPWT